MSLHFQRSLASQLSPTDYSPSLISSVFPLNNTVGVRIPLQWSFSISLLPDTCQGDGTDDIAYASPGLPPWLTFDSSYLVFSGESPASSGNFTITLECTLNEESVMDSFDIVVMGQLDLPSSLQPIVASPRNVVQSTLGTMKIDKARLTTDQLASLVVTTMPQNDWVTWNSNLEVLLIQIPDSYIDLSNMESIILDLDVSVPTVLGASTNLPITILPYLFQKFTFPSFQTSGNVILPLSPFLRDQSATLSVSLQPPEASGWLQYEPDSKTILGNAPHALAYDTVRVDMAAMSSQTGLNASASITITICNECPTGSAHDLARTSKIYRSLVIVASIAGLAFAMYLAFFLYKRMKRPRTDKPVAAVPNEKRPDLYLSVTGATLVDSSPTPALLNTRKKWWESWLRNTSPSVPKEATPLRWMVEDESTPTAQRTRSHSLPPAPSSSIMPNLPVSHSTPFSFNEQPDAPHPGPLNGFATPSQTFSTLASWESLDSWELAQRTNYETPQRRADFGPPRPGAASCIQSRPRVMKPRDNDALPDVDPDSVFFPRPIGAETSGTGMARSPHLEGLSRFGVAKTGLSREMKLERVGKSDIMWRSPALGD